MTRRQKTLVTVLAIVGVAALGVWFWSAGRPPAGDRGLAVGARAHRPAKGSRKAGAETVPLIDLDRLRHEAGGMAAGERDVFAFGAGGQIAGPPPGAPPIPVPVPPPVASAPPASGSAGAVSSTGGFAPLPFKFIGAVKAPSGTWVAALLTDSKEVVTGREGDIVALRYRVAHIGVESVDLVDVISGREQRIRLGGK